MTHGSITGTGKSSKRIEPLDLDKINKVMRRETLNEVPENEEQDNELSNGSEVSRSVTSESLSVTVSKSKSNLG